MSEETETTVEQLEREHPDIMAEEDRRMRASEEEFELHFKASQLLETTLIDEHRIDAQSRLSGAAALVKSAIRSLHEVRDGGEGELLAESVIDGLKLCYASLSDGVTTFDIRRDQEPAEVAGYVIVRHPPGELPYPANGGSIYRSPGLADVQRCVSVSTLSGTDGRRLGIAALGHDGSLRVRLTVPEQVHVRRCHRHYTGNPFGSALESLPAWPLETDR